MAAPPSDQTSAEPSAKLFVGGLSWNTTDQSLRDAFASFGEIESTKVITDRETGRSRGFGFVTYLNVEDSRNARDKMQNQEVDGRQVRCDFASEGRGSRQGFDNRSGGGGRFGGGDRFGGDRRGSAPYSRGGGRGGFGGGDRGDRGDRSTATSSTDTRSSYRVPTATERLPKGLPDWFARNDTDADGQVMMAEYMTEFTEARAVEFAGYDLNGDGIITPEECLEVDGK